MKRAELVILLALLAALLAIGMGCAATSRATMKGTLTVLHAGSLSVPFEDATREFRKIYPHVKVEREPAGSHTTIRKVTELGKLADVIGSADYAAIKQLMFPDFAEWYIIFASNQMAIAYTNWSKYKDEITPDNWYEILTREGVEYGGADPDADPCGYRTLMVWQLAEKHYNVPGLYHRLVTNYPEKNIRPKSVELTALLQSGDLDYAFGYRSVAIQHGLSFIELPPQINLSDIKYEDFYAKAKVEVAGTKPGIVKTQTGQLILYAVTIPKNAPRTDLGIAFLELLLGSEGQAIMEKNGQSPIVPAITNDLLKLPEGLKSYVIEKR